MEITVLNNQQSLLDESVGDNVFLIDISTIQPHPDNSMFDTDPKQDNELSHSIAALGQLQTAIVNRRVDGTLRMVSGHRRAAALMANNIYMMKCEIIEVDDETELVMLFHSNINRGLKDHYKIRFFKAVKQILRQNKNGQNISSTYEIDSMTNALFVRICTKSGFDTKGKRIWEVIQFITGFSKHEQDILTHVCDEVYRNDVLSRISNTKQRGKVAKQWQQMEQLALDGEIPLSLIDNEVKALVKMMEKKPEKASKKNEAAIKLPSADIAKQELSLTDYEEGFINAWSGSLKKLCKKHNMAYDIGTFRFLIDGSVMYNMYRQRINDE